MQIHYVDFKSIGKKYILPFTLEIDDEELKNYKGVELEAYWFSKLIEKYNEMLGFSETDAERRESYIKNNPEVVAITMHEISW